MPQALFPLTKSLVDLPVFHVPFGASGDIGVAALSASLTINGITVEPEFVYYGGDATHAAGAGLGWPAQVGTAAGLTYNAGAGGSILNNGSPLLGADDDSVKGDGNAYYTAQNNSIGDLTTEDMVLELVFKATRAVGNTIVLAKKNGNNEGLRILFRSNGLLEFSIEDSAANTAQPALTTLSDGAWYHVLWFVNRDEASVNGFRGYVNGSDDGGIDPSDVGSATSAIPLSIGASNIGVDPTEVSVAYAAMWKHASWHQAGAAGPAEWATIAEERFLRLAGGWPLVAKGTSAPTVRQRAYGGMLEKRESSEQVLYLCGDNWVPRACSIVDKSATEVAAYLVEQQVANLMTHSNDLAGNWTKEDAGDVITADQSTAPDRGVTLDKFVCDNTNGAHGVTRASETLAASQHVASCWIKKDDTQWWKLENQTIANGDAYFDLTNGVVGVGQGAGIDAVHIQGPYFGDSYRISIEFTGTVAAHTIAVGPCDADGTATYSGGDGAKVQGYAGMAQVELGDYPGNPYPTSYIETSAATATRIKDALSYKGDDGNLGGVGSNKAGTAIFDIVLPDINADNSVYALSLSDGNGTNDYIFFAGLSNDFPLYRIQAGGGGTELNLTGDVDIFDGNKHTIRITWQVGECNMYIDGVLNKTGTAADIPDDLDVIDVGMYIVNAFHLDGYISNLKIYGKVVAP